MVSQCHVMAEGTTHRNVSRSVVQVLSLGEYELEKLKVLSAPKSQGLCSNPSD